MISRMRTGIVVSAAATVAALFPVTSPATATAADDGCSDVTLIFARGTNEPSGIGQTGQDFVDQLIPRLQGRTLTVRPVEYSASLDFWNSAIEGIADTANAVRNIESQCASTQVVLGGFSQGAAVVGYTTSAAVPEGIDPADVPSPLGAEDAARVSSVVMFGTPTRSNLGIISAPPITIGPSFQEKTLQLCHVDDPVCVDGGREWSAHNSYTSDGMMPRAADFVVEHLAPAPISKMH
ncbi:MAG: cutinase family protein [Spirochaetes bacterium]|nr:MAG: cutinase family protein [Spirochaetota bacterium]